MQHPSCHLFEVTLVWARGGLLNTAVGSRQRQVDTFPFLNAQCFAGVWRFHVDILFVDVTSEVPKTNVREMFILLLLTKPISALSVKAPALNTCAVQSTSSRYAVQSLKALSFSLPLSRACEI